LVQRFSYKALNAVVEELLILLFQPAISRADNFFPVNLRMGSAHLHVVIWTCI